MTGLYSYTTERLFERLVQSFTAFCESPSEEGLLEVLFPLYHLREWICPGGYDSYKYKANENLTKEEVLHSCLHNMDEYEAVRALCNNAKHYNAVDLTGRTDTLQGLRCGFGCAGDSLGITHFTLDGREIRDIFWAVYKVYFDYFRNRT
jgi:hypothetical protein